jgi:hypothetical protein
MTEEKFIFTASAKKNIFITIAVGFILLVLGLILVATTSHGHDEHADATHKEVKAQAHGSEAGHGADKAAEGPGQVHAEEHGEHHASPVWLVRLKKNIWHHNVFFIGISLIGVFFIAFNYVAWAGWGVTIKRVPEAIGSFLPYIGVFLFVSFFFVKGDLFHWTHDELFNPDSKLYDPIIAGKASFLNLPFFIFRTLAYIFLWVIFWHFLRKYSIQEDLTGDFKWHDKSVVLSAAFLVVFGITSSTSAWDWVMSIDTHFFSTMFGWYVFASWFVTGLAVITLFVIYLKENGYLSIVNENHLHDLGKFMFAFSVFWTYIWFAQFLLIYYANIPEESVYFVDRLKNDVYSPFFFFNLIINFLVPFLILMTRDAKRQLIILKLVAFVIIIGHWSDFYLMMTPATLGDNGKFDFWFFFVEVGMFLIYAGLFLLVTLSSLAKVGLMPRKHPMLEESVHHHVY